MKEDKTEEEILEAVPQNFPQLLLIIHRQATLEIGRGNLDGFVQTVKTLHQQLSSFHDKKYLDAKAEIDRKYDERHEKIDADFQDPQYKYHGHVGDRLHRINNINRNWAMDLLGLLSDLEGRKGLLVEKTTILGDKK